MVHLSNNESMTSGNKNTHVKRWITFLHISLTLVLASQNHLKPEGNLPQIPVELTKNIRHRYHKGVLDIKRLNNAQQSNDILY